MAQRADINSPPPSTGEGEGGGEVRAAAPPILTFPRTGGKGLSGVPPKCPNLLWTDLDKFFQPLRPRFRWDHFEDFRSLVLAMAFAWGRHNVTNLYRYPDAQHHRTRFNDFCVVRRWDPQAALRQKAQEPCKALGLPFQKTTELAAHLIQEFQAPPGVTVMVLFDAYYLCHTVVHGGMVHVRTVHVSTNDPFP